MNNATLPLFDAPPSNLTARLADHLKARPNLWVDGRELATVGGAYGWRSRISDARRKFAMRIDNRQRHVHLAGGLARYTVSEYRFVPEGTPRHENAAIDAPTSTAAGCR